LSQLTHPNTVRVFLYGELAEDSSLYIVMEFLEGRNLNQTVRTQGPFPLQRALPILIQVCGALDEAHRAGIVHRDLKPENIFLCQQGGLKDFPKVLDFGLAKVTERQMRPGSVILTQEGMVFGTPEFMSPEQAQGKTLTAASDIYSLAVILYEVLTGKLPFDAKNPMDYLQAHVATKPIPLNRRVPGKLFPALLEQVIDKALAKRPEDRFATAAEFGEALQAVLSGKTSLGGEPTTGDIPTAVMAAAQRDLSSTGGDLSSSGDGSSSAVASERHRRMGRRLEAPKTSALVLVGVALGFTVIGAGIAILVMKALGRT
jgi:serine/threonine-protein kinase